VCLVGRNGAGKTTTIDSIMGLLPMRSGRIRLGDQDVTRLPAHRRALLGIGYSPEDAGIFPDLTVAENFRISQSLARSGGRPAGATGAEGIDARVFALFPEVQGFLQRRGLFLSGGQKKMVAISRALTLSPTILLLDEPFEGLAPVVVSRFIEAVKQIKAMGISLLIAESNLASASRVADRLYAIDRGEIIFEGSPQGVFANEDVMKTLRG
jgi:branched-chain amino acid transport system ATP-binding protein